MLATIVISVAFWVADSFVDTSIFHEGSLVSQLIHPKPHELWARLFVIFITLIFTLTYTREKQIERDLECKSLLLNSATGSVFVRDLDGKILYVNEAACTTRGYTKDELMMSSFDKLDVPEYSEMVKPRIEYLKNAGSAVFESAHLKKDGTIMNVEINASLVTLRGRKVIVSVVRDITGRKEAEAEMRRAKELSDALNDINALINSTLEFDMIMQRAVVEAAKAIGAETAAIDLHEGDHWVLKYINGLPHELIGQRFTDSEFMVSSLAARSKELIVVNDALSDMRVNRELTERLNIRSMLVVPLTVREHAIGTLVFHYHSEATPFDELQIDFAGKLGTSISLAIENARLYASKRTIADTLQEAILTVPQTIPGIDFSYLYHSATEATRVGGDFYDLFELEGGKVGIVIGDVSGKGLNAATLTSLVKDAIKAYAYDSDSPACVMAKTNEFISSCSELATFITVFFGILDTRSGEFTYCSAGHPPAILRKKTPETSLLFTSSPFIGAFQGLHYADDKTIIQKGDILVLYTDGAIEPRSDDEFFGEERLIELIKSFDSQNIQELPQVIFSEVMSFCTGNPSDDIALLTVSLDH
ncbi:SpoIIE family protein phosphatase [Candidatus Aquicultor sp.]